MVRRPGIKWKTKSGTRIRVDTDRRLDEAGWAVLRIWEHEPAESAADMVEARLAGLRGERP